MGCDLKDIVKYLDENIEFFCGEYLRMKDMGHWSPSTVMMSLHGYIEALKHVREYVEKKRNDNEQGSS